MWGSIWYSDVKQRDAFFFLLYFMTVFMFRWKILNAIYLGVWTRRKSRTECRKGETEPHDYFLPLFAQKIQLFN